MIERSLYHGQCIKCGAITVRVRTVSFGSVSGSSRGYEPVHLARLFVCVTCGYSEVYARTPELASIAQSRDWERVAYTPAPTEYTGVTARLEPPEERT